MSAVRNQRAVEDATDGYGSITIRSADASTEAEFMPSSNMGCLSLSHQGVESLHPGGRVAGYAARGTTVGIPLVHPWANRLNGVGCRVEGRQMARPRGETIPLDGHGLSIPTAMPVLMRWEPVRRGRGALTGVLRWSSPRQLRLFPFPHGLTVEATVEAEGLTIAATLMPIGEESVPVSFGYPWQVTLGGRSRLLPEATMASTGGREPLTVRPFRLGERDLDVGFGSLAAAAQFEVESGEVTVTVEFLERYPNAQLYAPAGEDFIRLEPMPAATRALVSGDGRTREVAPGGQFRAAFRISIAPKSGTDRLGVVQ